MNKVTHTQREGGGRRSKRWGSIQVERKKIMIFVVDEYKGHDISDRNKETNHT